MNLKKYLSITFFCIGLVLINGCGNNDTKKLVGKWEGHNLNDGSQVIYEFTPDGKFVFKNLTFDSNLSGSYSYNDADKGFDLKFEANGGYIVKYKTEFYNENSLYFYGTFGNTIFKVDLKKISK